MAEGDRRRTVPDVPTGYTEGRRETHPDAPDLPADEAGEPARGNQTTHPGPQNQPGDGRAAQGSAGRPPGRAEQILPGLDVDWHMERGSDSGSPLAGLLAAAAATPQSLDERAYRQYVDSHGHRWPTVKELERAYGSFSAALRAAGIEDPNRGTT